MCNSLLHRQRGGTDHPILSVEEVHKSIISRKLKAGRWGSEEYRLRENFEPWSVEEAAKSDNLTVQLALLNKPRKIYESLSITHTGKEKAYLLVMQEHRLFLVSRTLSEEWEIYNSAHFYPWV